MYVKKNVVVKEKYEKKVETDEEILIFKIKKSVLTSTDSFDIILVRFWLDLFVDFYIRLFGI